MSRAAVAPSVQRAARACGVLIGCVLIGCARIGCVLLGCAVCCSAIGACAAPPCQGAGCPPEVLATGTAPNDVRLSRCGDDEVAVVPASFDARVDAIALDGDVRGSVFLGVGANPWAIAGEADRLWVTLWSDGAVALVDACASAIDGRLYISDLVEVSPPVTLRAPADVDGDGVFETEVTQMTPRSPQAVVARGDEAWVSYTNLLEASASADEPPRLGPGVIARLAAAESGPALVALATVPCTNPQGLALDDDTLWVSCSGPIGPDASGRQSALADGALLALDARTLEVTRRIEMARFAPATPALSGGRIVVGSLVTPRVAVLAESAASLDEGALVSLPGADVDSVFEIALHGEVVHAPVFSRDRLFSFSLDAPPTRVSAEDGRLVGAGGDPPRGLLALDRREGFSVAAVALLTLSAEVVLLRDVGLP